MASSATSGSSLSPSRARAAGTPGIQTARKWAASSAPSPTWAGAAYSAGPPILRSQALGVVAGIDVRTGARVGCARTFATGGVAGRAGVARVARALRIRRATTAVAGPVMVPLRGAVPRGRRGVVFERRTDPVLLTIREDGILEPPAREALAAIVLDGLAPGQTDGRHCSAVCQHAGRRGLAVVVGIAETKRLVAAHVGETGGAVLGVGLTALPGCTGDRRIQWLTRDRWCTPFATHASRSNTSGSDNSRARSARDTTSLYATAPNRSPSNSTRATAWYTGTSGTPSSTTIQVPSRPAARRTTLGDRTTVAPA